MWYFVSPEVVFGEDALSRLSELQGRSAFIVTDQNMVKLGFVERVKEQLTQAGIATAHVFDQVEPDPSLDTVKKGSAMMRRLEPDWVVALGGGSVMDAAKAMRVEYVRPDIPAEEINPLTTGLDLSTRCKLVCVSTTSGTGAEATWAVVLTDTKTQTKLGLGSRDVLADIAIVDPALAASMPAQVTADTGMDVLTHGVEGFTSTFKNDISDGLCIKAIQLVFQYLPRAVANGDDMEAREKMHNAACIAGLGFGNSLAALAHSLGHALGTLFHVPHGRAVGLYLPYAIEFIGEGREDLWTEIAHAIRVDLPAGRSAASVLAQVIRDLAGKIKQPLSVREAGIPRDKFESAIPKLIDNAVADSQLVSTLRVPSEAETEKLFRYAYEGKSIDF
jgi:alcohol dehydrogenase class IV